MILGIEIYRKIIDELVEKSFPELKNNKIYIKEKNVKYRAHVSYFPWGMRIIVSDKLRKFPEKIVKRILVHELCHLELFLNQGIIKTNLVYLAYLISQKVRKKTEAEAIILMIKKGYGKEVIEARKDNLKRGLRYALTDKEIKSYIKKF